MGTTLYELAGAEDERFSPFCWRARFALAHKGIKATTVGLGFLEIPRAVGGPHRTVPVLDDDGTIISDSWEIAEHLDRTRTERPLLGKGGSQKAVYKFLEAWTNQVLHPAIVPLVVLDIYDRIRPTDRDYFRDSREKRVGRLEDAAGDVEVRITRFRSLLTPLRYSLGRQPWLGGEAPDYADYIVAGSLQWPRVISPKPLLSDDDIVRQWFERCLGLFDGLGRSAPAAKAASPLLSR